MPNGEIFETLNLRLRNMTVMIMDRLPAHFIRLHQSFIVTKNFVTSFNPETEALNMLDEVLPISRSFKK